MQTYKTSGFVQKGYRIANRNAYGAHIKYQPILNHHHAGDGGDGGDGGGSDG